jgi:hypothetical protein
VNRPWLVALGVWLGVVGQPALAQTLETRLELRFSTALAISNAPAAASWGLGALLEARYDLGPLRLQLVLDPGVSFSRSVTTDAGLTELYALYREGELDFSAGLERLPLEVARLTLPYSLEPVGPLGHRRGRWGLRLSWNPEATRLRLAVLEEAGQLVPVLSLRREFGGFELEAHALYRAKAVLGLGGSGTVAGVVVYGEGWLLFNPSEARYALGLSGSLGEGVWTLEGGYASLPLLLPLGPFLAGQWAVPLGEEALWNLSAYLLLDGPVRPALSARYTQSRPDAELSLTLHLQLGPTPALGLGLGVRAFP